MANSVRWYDHVLRREDGDVLRKALDFEVESQRKKWRMKRTWKKHVEEESVSEVRKCEGMLETVFQHFFEKPLCSQWILHHS